VSTPLSFPRKRESSICNDLLDSRLRGNDKLRRKTAPRIKDFSAGVESYWQSSDAQLHGFQPLPKEFVNPVMRADGEEKYRSPVNKTERYPIFPVNAKCPNRPFFRCDFF